MSFFTMIRDTIQYISEGAVRVFSPNRDEYPETGVQPFDGDPLSKRVDSRGVEDSNK